MGYVETVLPVAVSHSRELNNAGATSGSLAEFTRVIEQSQNDSTDRSAVASHNYSAPSVL